MINKEIMKAIYALNPSVVTIRGDVAYDANDNVVEYDKAAVEAYVKRMLTKPNEPQNTHPSVTN